MADREFPATGPDPHFVFPDPVPSSTQPQCHPLNVVPDSDPVPRGPAGHPSNTNHAGLPGRPHIGHFHHLVRPSQGYSDSFEYSPASPNIVVPAPHPSSPTLIGDLPPTPASPAGSTSPAAPTARTTPAVHTATCANNTAPTPRRYRPRTSTTGSSARSSYRGVCSTPPR